MSGIIGNLKELLNGKREPSGMATEASGKQYWGAIANTGKQSPLELCEGCMGLE